MAASLTRLLARLRHLAPRRWLVWLVLALAALSSGRFLSPDMPAFDGGDGGNVVQQAFAQRRSGLWLETPGRVTRLLRDDLHGDRHQRFIVETPGGISLLVAHNIDLAPRVPLHKGDRVELRGRYEWNEKGGLIHWTHHDPQGREAGGWIGFKGKKYR